MLRAAQARPPSTDSSSSGAQANSVMAMIRWRHSSKCITAQVGAAHEPEQRSAEHR